MSNDKIWALMLILMGGIMLFFCQYSDVAMLRVIGAILGLITIGAGCLMVIKTVWNDRLE